MDPQSYASTSCHSRAKKRKESCTGKSDFLSVADPIHVVQCLAAYAEVAANDLEFVERHHCSNRDTLELSDTKGKTILHSSRNLDGQISARTMQQQMQVVASRNRAYTSRRVRHGPSTDEMQEPSNAPANKARPLLKKRMHIQRKILDQRMQNAPSADEVTAIWLDNSSAVKKNSPHIVVFGKSNQSHRIMHYYGCYDPLQYPLLFPQGDCGRHVGLDQECAVDGGRDTNPMFPRSSAMSQTPSDLLMEEAICGILSCGQ